MVQTPKGKQNRRRCAPPFGPVLKKAIHSQMVIATRNGWLSHACFCWLNACDKNKRRRTEQVGTSGSNTGNLVAWEK